MMRARQLGRKVRDRDSLITVGCVLAIAFAFVLLWRLGVPLPLLILGLLLSCLAACLLFMLLGLRSHRKAQEYLMRLGNRPELRAEIARGGEVTRTMGPRASAPSESREVPARPPVEAEGWGGARDLAQRSSQGADVEAS